MCYAFRFPEHLVALPVYIVVDKQDYICSNFIRETPVGKKIGKESRKTGRINRVRSKSNPV